MKRPPIINHLLRLKEKVRLLEFLADIELAQSFLINSINDLETLHKTDVFYSLLNANINVLE
jgi:hypothetical protein